MRQDLSGSAQQVIDWIDHFVPSLCSNYSEQRVAMSVNKRLLTSWGKYRQSAQSVTRRCWWKWQMDLIPELSTCIFWRIWMFVQNFSISNSSGDISLKITQNQKCRPAAGTPCKVRGWPKSFSVEFYISLPNLLPIHPKVFTIFHSKPKKSTTWWHRGKKFVL